MGLLNRCITLFLVLSVFLGKYTAIEIWRGRTKIKLAPIVGFQAAIDNSPGSQNNFPLSSNFVMGFTTSNNFSSPLLSSKKFYDILHT